MYHVLISRSLPGFAFHAHRCISPTRRITFRLFFGYALLDYLPHVYRSAFCLHFAFPLPLLLYRRLPVGIYLLFPFLPRGAFYACTRDCVMPLRVSLPTLSLRSTCPVTCCRPRFPVTDSTFRCTHAFHTTLPTCCVPWLPRLMRTLRRDAYKPRTRLHTGFVAAAVHTFATARLFIRCYSCILYAALFVLPHVYHVYVRWLPVYVNYHTAMFGYAFLPFPRVAGFSRSPITLRFFVAADSTFIAPRFPFYQFLRFVGHIYVDTPAFTTLPLRLFHFTRTTSCLDAV